MTDEEDTPASDDGFAGGYDPLDWNRVTRWLLFDGSRNRVAVALLLAVFVLLLVLGQVWPVQYRELMQETNTVQTVFNTLLGGVILLVSIVVAIASVGISQELTSIGSQYDRVDNALDFRREVESMTKGRISPAQPGQFLYLILECIRSDAADLQDIADDQADEDFRRLATALVNDIDESTAELIGTLDRVKAGTTGELLIGLKYDCSWQLHIARRLRLEFDEQLDDDAKSVLDDLVQSLKYFITGREYFKTMYYKREFSDLSTVLLVVALPVIVLTTYVLVALDARVFPDVTAFGYSPLTLFINTAYTITLAPYVILTSYVLRAATVTDRTPSAGPFATTQSEAKSLDETTDIRSDQREGVPDRMIPEEPATDD